MLGSFQTSQDRTPRGEYRVTAAVAKDPNSPAPAGRRLPHSGSLAVAGTSVSAAQSGVPQTVKNTWIPARAASATMWS